MKKIILLFLLFIFSSSLIISGQKDPKKDPRKIKVVAFRITQPIVIDGKLDEEMWQTANVVTGFTQRDPDEGKPATQKTVVRICYDDDAIYIGARMFDSSPELIIARLVRKDNDSNSDQFMVFFDPFNDKRSGYYFGLTAAGTIKDGVLFNDDWDDDSWDAVWVGKVNIDDKGWTAEMRIPFSQMRFNLGNDNIWGINFKRDIKRHNETDYLSYVPKTESGFVSHFVDLNGLSNIKPQNKLEILPYITAKSTFTRKEIGNPFNNGSSFLSNAGLDLKYGLGSGLTLNATFNPDFGQVEIDPAVINLSDAETFFSEKRPFFVEGSSIFNFGKGGARNYWGFNWGSPDFFYSRRIGRDPQGSLPDYDYVDRPSGTHILGAAKLTGKIGDFNVGVIQALTKREFADIDLAGNKSSVEVEPLSYYGVLRGQKEFNEGKQGLGFMSTLANRSFSDNRLRDEINTSAFSGGIDGWTFLDESKTWVAAGWVGMSNIKGNSKRILDVQQNSRHYFQRPDFESESLDSTATSLTGFAGRFVLNRQKGNFFFNSAFGFITPKFDVNDLGFLWRANIYNGHIGGGYSWTEPTDLYRYAELGGAFFRSYDFDGNKTWGGYFQFGYVQFLNYYSINWNLAYNPESFSNNATRGGPLMLNLPGYQVSFNLKSDSRKNWVLRLDYFTYNQTDGANSWNIGTGIEFRPASNIFLSLSPRYSKNNDHAQYIGTYTDPLATNTFGKRYVFGELDQTTFSADIRLNWTFTPNLSFQLFIQPLISTGKYTNYKELARPSSFDFNVYGKGNSTFDNNNFIADPDGSGPAAPIDIGKQDFKFSSLRGNAVLRWEYSPGSVLFLVWTQTRTGFEDNGEFQFGRSFSNLFSLHPDNIFLIKFTHWFNM